MCMQYLHRSGEGIVRSSAHTHSQRKQVSTERIPKGISIPVEIQQVLGALLGTRGKAQTCEVVLQPMDVPDRYSELEIQEEELALGPSISGRQRTL